MKNLDDYTDVDVFEHSLPQGGKLTILRGGWYKENPKSYMDMVVCDYMEHRLHNQFVEIHMDIPQVRVIIEGINDFKYTDLKTFLGKRKNDNEY